MSPQGRVQRGVPTGGQFAATRRSEPSISLADGAAAADGGEHTGYPAGDWRAFGYSDDEATAWARFGFDRRQADDWKGFGFNPSEAAIWRHPGFTPSQARAWESTPIADPRSARRWADAGFDPEEDRDWLGRMGPEQAAAFREAGWSANTSREWAFEGFNFQQAHDWRTGHPGVTPRSASVYREQGKTPHSLQTEAPSMSPTRTPNPLRKAGPFRNGTVTLAERGGSVSEVDARIVGGTLAVHKSLRGNGWALSHVATGRSIVPPLRRKADAEKVARTLAVIDPGLLAGSDVATVRQSAEEKVFVKDRWLSRGQLPKMASEAVRRPHSESAAYIQHLLEHPVGEDTGAVQ